MPPVATNPLRQRFIMARSIRSDVIGRSQGGAAYAVLAQKKSSCLTPLRLRHQILGH